MENIPKRVLLRGFEAADRSAAVEWLRLKGVAVVNIQSLADLVVAGPDASPEMLGRARSQDANVVSWDVLRATLVVDRSAADLLAGEVAELSEMFFDPISEAEVSAPLEWTEHGLRVLDLLLPGAPSFGVVNQRVPHAQQFAHLCLDQQFLETLRAVALGVLYNIPVALEGETAASKTTAVLYLAHWLGQPVVRLNLSGHTDAAELVGRYVPADADALLNWEELTPGTPWLRPSSRKVFLHAENQGRGLTEAERLLVLGREGFPVSGWRFQEGYLPQAMRSGWWLLLDEMNLAETQVLERLNSALENPAGLVLTEGNGTVFGPGGDVPVHPSFRMLATMNPAEYAGRALLSQAFADRWGVWHQAAVPGEREIEQLLEYLVFGTQPRVLLSGRVYQASARGPVYPELAAIADVRVWLRRLAVFHYGIFRAAGGEGATPSIGRLKKERYSFSRRLLLNLVRYVVEQIKSGRAPAHALISEAIQVFYVARIRGEPDRKAVKNMLCAGGFL